MKTTILTLALALAFSFAAVPADAGLTEGQKCAFKANLLSGKLSLCLNKADANVSKGKAADTATADAKCESKFRSGWDKTREKAQDKDSSLGADCDGAMSDAVRDSVEASALIAVGRDLAAFAVSDADLLDDSGVQALIDEAVAAVDITCDNESICTGAGGTYDAGTDTCCVDSTSGYASLCSDAGGTYDAGDDTCSVGSVEESLSITVNNSNIGHVFDRVELGIEIGTYIVEDDMGEEMVSLGDRDFEYDSVAEGVNIQSGVVVEIENTAPATWTGYRVVLGVAYNGSFSPKWYGPVQSLDSGWESLQLTSPSLPVTVSSVSDNVTRVEWGQNEITGFAVETLSSASSLCEAAGGTWANDACTTVACD
jgi:hypothetical protein